MMKHVKLWIPLHVTGLWIPVWRHNPLLSGSLGAGLLMEPGIEVEATRAGEWRVEITVEGSQLNSLPSIASETLKLMSSATPAHIRISSPVPLGAGFAVSAGIALGIALGAGLLSGMGIVESAGIAHEAEVRAGTGLGDVVAMLYGRGLEIRIAPGGPGLASVESYPVPRLEILAAVLGRMETKEMHRVLGERLYEAAAPRLARLLSRPELITLLQEARGFSIESGMVSEELARLLDKLVDERVLLGWYVKKKVLVMVPEEGETRRVEELIGGIIGSSLYKLKLTMRPLEIGLE